MERPLDPGVLVCIIDDNDDIREIYGRKFESEGFQTILAKDGAEGLQVIKIRKPELILLDIEMPVMDGLSVLRELRRDPELSGIPVVILSNVERDDVVQAVTEAGVAKYYVIKSLTDPQKVVDIAREALQDKKEEAA